MSYLLVGMTAQLPDSTAIAFAAVVTGLADSADGFISELKSSSIENLEIQWIPANWDGRES